MLRRRKLRQILALLGVLLALLLLAGALQSLALDPGRPWRPDFSWLRRFDSYQGEVRAEWLFVAIRLLVIMALVLFPFALIVALFDPAMRRRILRGLLMWGLLLLALQGYQNLERPGLEVQQPEEIPAEEVPESLGEMLPPETFTAPEDWVIGTVSLGVAILLLAAIGWGIWKLWHQPREEAPLPLLAREAENALTSLYAGGTLRDVIIRCYDEMEQVVARSRGLHRQGTMTAREFETQLLKLGLPQEPVADLIALFEAARYGRRTPGTIEQERAIASLRAIIAACEVAR